MAALISVYKTRGKNECFIIAQNSTINKRGTDLFYDTTDSTSYFSKSFFHLSINVIQDYLMPAMFQLCHGPAIQRRPAPRQRLSEEIACVYKITVGQRDNISVCA